LNEEQIQFVLDLNNLNLILMSLPKIVYSVKVSETGDGFTYEECGSSTDIKLFYKKENAENYARIKVLEKMEDHFDESQEEFIEARNMSWLEMEQNINNGTWFKGDYVELTFHVKIEETEIE